MIKKTATYSLQFLRNFTPVIPFIFLVFALVFIGKVFAGSMEKPGPGFYLWVLSPMLACIIIRLWKKDWSEFGIKPRIKSKWRWYLVSLVAYPLMLCFAVAIGKISGIIEITNFTLPGFLQAVAPAFVAFFVFAIFEEIGWRGYLSPKLEVQGIKPIYIYIFVGLIWVSWHLPFMSQLTFLYVKEDLNTFIPRYFLNGIVLTCVYHELRMQSDSLWPPVIFHATGNAMGHILAAKYVTLKTGTDSIGAIGTGYISIILYFILGIILYNQRRRWIGGKGHKSTSSANATRQAAGASG